MKRKFGILAFVMLAAFEWLTVDKTEAYHNFFFRSAADITTGTLNNARLDPSSVTMQGNLSNGLAFPDGSLQTTAAGSSQWGTSGSDIRNTNTGNVGIGTTAPGSKLTVLGTFTSTGASNLATIEGNVGIGTSAPTRRLDVVGSAGTAGVVMALSTGSTKIAEFASSSASINVALSLTAPLSMTSTSTFSGQTTFGGQITVSNSSISINGTASEMVVSTVSNVSRVGFVGGSSITAVASQAQMEAATSNNAVVTPFQQQFHPGMAKAWAVFSGSGTPAVQAGYNISSVTGSGGAYTVNFTNPLSSNNYYIACTPMFMSGTAVVVCNIDDGAVPSATSFKVLTFKGSTEGAVAPNKIYVAVYGDQ